MKRASSGSSTPIKNMDGNGTLPSQITSMERENTSLLRNNRKQQGSYTSNSVNNKKNKYEATHIRKITWNLPNNDDDVSPQQAYKVNDTKNPPVVKDPFLDEDDFQKKKRVNVPLIGFMIVMIVATISTITNIKTTKSHFVSSSPTIQSSMTPTNQNDQDAFENISAIPFPSIYRSKYNIDASPEKILNTSLLSHEIKMSPFPTGAFWTNFVMHPQTDNEIFSYPIVAYPYALKWSHDVIALSYPAYRRIVQPLILRDDFYPDISVTAIEGVQERIITSFDPLSVTAKMQNDIHTWFETYLVQGSPYITMRFEKATPKLTALSLWDNIECVSESDVEKGICTITTKRDNTVEFTGTRFVLKQAEGQDWLIFLYCQDRQHSFKLAADRRSIVSTTPVSGILRLAIVPPGGNLDGGTTMMTLIQHSTIFPTSGNVLIDYNDKRESSTYASVVFSYDVESIEHQNDVELLMLALPHHLHALSLSKSNLPNLDAEFKCIKGPMIPTIGNEWTAHIEVFNAKSLNAQSKITEKNAIAEIEKSVMRDKDLIIPTAQDVYGFGKEIARMAQLVEVASSIGMKDVIVKEIASTVCKYLVQWLDGDSEDEFLYDMDFGGVITERGLKNYHSDFGNGWYNDHHYHNGYFIYAATILAKFNSTFLEKYAPHITTLVHDIANENFLYSKTTSNDESRRVPALQTLFPFARHKSWYDGHSWASGLFPEANGKNQESSSEAINAYYASYLWYDMLGLTRFKNFAALLCSMEIRSAREYWQTGPSNTLYPEVFAKNYMVGSLGGLDVTSTTWFGDKIIYVHLINFLPITGITTSIFSEEYVEGEYKFLERYVATTEETWQGYIAALHSIVDPTTAWQEAQDLVSYQLDSALSKSQVLHFIASQPGLGTNWNISKLDTDSSCSGNGGCAILGLDGDCCPTSSGVYLGCCYPQ